MSDPVRPLSASLETLARDQQPQLLAVAMRLCGHPSDATDLVQDTYERALGAAPRLSPGTNLAAYLVTVLHHLFIDRVRRRRVELPSDPALLESAAPESEPEPAPRWLQVGDDELAAAISRLNDEFREVFALHARGLSYQEIAERLGIPRATVGTRLARARRKLRSLLGGDRKER